jgi:hypothetical protein
MEIIKRLQEERARLAGQLSSLDTAIETLGGANVARMDGRRSMSIEARRKISAAQKARWAAKRGKKTVNRKAPAKRRMSAAGRKAIIAATKARWAKYRADKAKVAKAA